MAGVEAAACVAVAREGVADEHGVAGVGRQFAQVSYASVVPIGEAPPLEGERPARGQVEEPTAPDVVARPRRRR